MNALVNEMVSDVVVDGHTLAATKHEDGTYDVWVIYCYGGSSSAAYEDVTQEDLDDVKRHVGAKLSILFRT